MGDFLPRLLATLTSFLVSLSISGMPGQDLCVSPSGRRLSSPPRAKWAGRPEVREGEGVVLRTGHAQSLARLPSPAARPAGYSPLGA